MISLRDRVYRLDIVIISDGWKDKFMTRVEYCENSLAMLAFPMSATTAPFSLPPGHDQGSAPLPAVGVSARAGKNSTLPNIHSKKRRTIRRSDPSTAGHLKTMVKGSDTAY